MVTMYLLKWLCIYSSGDHSKNNRDLKWGILHLWYKLSNQCSHGYHAICNRNIIFLDFSKAFDTVDHILLQKLSRYGVRGNALSWFHSYLDNKKQFLSYNGAKSDIKTVKCGVPQGSILGPLLLLLFMNDLADISSQSFPFYLQMILISLIMVKTYHLYRCLLTRNFLKYQSG